MKRLTMLGMFVLAGAAMAAETLTSPDGTLSVSVDVGKELTWSVRRRGVDLVLPSRLGLDFIDQRPWTGFRLKNASRRSVDETWTTRLYRRETVRDRANELTLALEEAQGRLLTLVFRAYDEGVAFRYVVPEQKDFDGFQLRGESTTWRFPEGASGWFTTYGGFVTSQEQDFRRRAISDLKPKELVGMPALVDVGGQTVALCEADLTNWAGIFYRTPAKGQTPGAATLEAALTPLPKSNACAGDVAVIRMTPAASPWRVMLCGEGPLDLLKKNDVLMNLNPPPDPSIDFSWVVPGATSWDWWVDSNNSLSTELTLKLVDFAAEMGWKYHTIDGGWYGWARRPNHGPDVPVKIRKGFDLHRIIAHAKEKGIGIWVWLHWEALQDNGVEETLAKLEKWGVKGVKIDFLDRQDQWMVRWYESTVRAAARHHIMVNYHGAFKPTGMNRTWPNQITREGIRGNEMTKFTSQITPVHTATLPYTRFLLGPGDFTPGSFGNAHLDKFIPQCRKGHRYGDEKDRRPIWAEEIGTRAHALALCVAYDSPLMTLCDWPERYRGAKGVEALRALPTTWRNTTPLMGAVGKDFGVVREAFDGRHYFAYLGTEASAFELPLDFLPEGTWEAAVYADGPNAAVDATDLAESRRLVARGEKLKISTAFEGGAVVVFTRTSAASAGARFCVDAQRGSDANPGTAEKPFKTPQKARDALRALPSRDGAVVELTGHFDTIGPSILKLGKEDGAAASARPVVWRAGKGGAFFSGACRIGARDFAPVTGAALARLKPEVRGKVVQCDLAKFGVGELKPLPAKFNRWTEMELVSSGKAMTIARYPNTGWLEITNVIDRGVAPCDRTKDEWEFGVRGGTFEYSGRAPERWDVETGVYLFGFWCYDWSSDTLRVAKIDKEKKTITMEGVHTYGLGKPGKWCQAKVRYFAYNMLEELDAPGEWYVDRPTRTLYFYPTEAGLGDVSLSVAKDSLVTIEETKNIVLQGIDFKYSTGKAVGMGKCENVVLDGLTVSWLSQDAVSVWEGHDCVVRNCRISQIGSTGLSVYAGDRKSLTKCNHVVRGNDIGYCGRLARISGPCIRFGGCGILVEHNYFHDTPYLTVGYGGNEHLFQYNEIECSMLEAGDGGGMYTGRDWGSRGNVVRWNYLHHFGKDGVALREAQGRPSGCEALKKDVMVEGIYLDDCDSGELIYGNLFYKAGRAMFTGGGRDNTWLHNLVIDCTTAVHFDTRGLQRAKPGSGLKNGWDLLAKIEACGYTNEPWASRYPQLIGVMDKEPLLPIGTEYVSNVAVRCGYFYNSYGHATKFLQERAPNRANVSYNPKDAARENREYPQTNATLRAKLEIRTDDAFAAQAEADPVGFQDTAAFKAAFPSFPRIPVEKIGLKGLAK